MIWGKYTWTFLHCLAEKIKEPYYHRYKNLLFEIFRIVCHNLPCPICQVHAKEKLAQTNFNLLRTKEQFKQYVFNFHNSVNERKSLGIADISILQTYKLYNFNEVLRGFLIMFKTTDSKHMLDQLHRQRSLIRIKHLLKTNNMIFTS